MLKFKYTAIDENGKQKIGIIDATSSDEANSKLGRMGLMPTDVVQAPASGAEKQKPNEATKGKSFKKAGNFAFGKIINQEELTMFTRQLATLLEAGLSLVRSLEVMVRQEKNLRFKAVLEQIIDQIKSGSSFSDSLVQYPKIFERIYINMIRAGEAGGVLDVVLLRLAGFMEKALKTKRKVKAAMVYPIVVISVAVSIVTLLMAVVVPKFQSIFDEMLSGAALPAPTQLIINISNLVRDNVLIFAISLVVSLFIFKFLLKTSFGANAFSWVAINIPKVGDLVRKVNIGRITRTFGTLLSSGVPVLSAIIITRDITDNIFFSSALTRIHDRVRDGETLAKPMEREKVFPDIVTSMIDVGEETGEMSEMLNRVADNYDEDVDTAVAGITSIIEPVMIVLLAVVVGFIVIALFLPIVEIIKQLS